MFLADAVANYVEGLTERQLDAPLMALLYREGYEDVHLVHGQYEFGKDIIARSAAVPVIEQCCIQSKAGNIGLPEWRAVRPQIEEMRTGSVVHPNFNPQLPRRLILVSNGRLTGAAPVSIQEYNSYHQERNEAPVEVWTLENLVPRFEHLLVEGVPAQDRARTLELLGMLGNGRGRRTDIADYARAWNVAHLSRSQRWGHRLTAAMLAREAAAAGREDLAGQVAFQLIASSWNSATETDRGAELRFAHELFLANALEFLDGVKGANLVTITLASPSPFGSFITHPVKSARIGETLSMLGLLAVQQGEDDVADAVDLVLSELVEKAVGLPHVVSDEFAFSLLAVSIYLAVRGKSEDVRGLLREAAVWTLDRVEFGDGIAREGEEAKDIVTRLLAPPYPKLRMGREPSGYVFSVLLDLAFLLDMRDLFDDILNDLGAVGAFPRIVYENADENRLSLIARLEYDADRPAIHHLIPSSSTSAGAAREWFDCVAIWATLRDRHVPSVLLEILADSRRTPSILT